MRLLVVEDSPELLKPIVAGLSRSGYAVEQASNGNVAAQLIRDNRFDLAILDIMLPGMDGLSLLRAIRQAKDQTRVLLLTAKDAVEDRVLGLRAGADDYLTKPFAFDELLARVEALLRRGRESNSTLMTVGRLSLDLAAKTASVDDEIASLTPREYAILEFLVRNRGRVVSRTEIEREVYDELVEPMSNVVDSAVCALRRKIDGPNRPSLIQTRRGLGYVVPREGE